MRTAAEAIEEAVRRIVDEAHPVRVVLFGSAARGDLGPDSDLDLLVVMPDGTDRLETTYRLHRRLRHLGWAKDQDWLNHTRGIACKGAQNDQS